MITAGNGPPSDGWTVNVGIVPEAVAISSTRSIMRGLLCRNAEVALGIAVEQFLKHRLGVSFRDVVGDDLFISKDGEVAPEHHPVLQPPRDRFLEFCGETTWPPSMQL